jgi:hypothetical protein
VESDLVGIWCKLGASGLGGKFRALRVSERRIPRKIRKMMS